MISPKLKILERQLNRATATTEYGGNEVSKMMVSYQAECDRIKTLAIKVAEDRCATLEAEVASLLTELSERDIQLSQARESVAQKVDDSKVAYKQEMEALCAKHSGKLEQMQSQIDALRGEVGRERQDKVKALAEKEAAQTACTKLEQQVTKLQDVKPVAPTPVAAQKPVSFTTKVTQRDEHGRIVSSETTPHF